jgi:hypothetical protein
MDNAVCTAENYERFLQVFSRPDQAWTSLTRNGTPLIDLPDDWFAYKSES